MRQWHWEQPVCKSGAFLLPRQNLRHMKPLNDGETYLSLKHLVPVRLLRNPFFEKVHQAELTGATKEELAELLGKGRAKKGMFEGNITEGELEIGQVSGMIKAVMPVSKIMGKLVAGFNKTSEKMNGYKI